ncbi:MAG: outer membrane protein transport protein [Candidatus Alcyoniella australis]|nr:outer membrane protein transport protein [Candidatus Alcyoniella australis]
MRIRICLLICAAALFVMATSAVAGLSYVPNTYGLSARGVGMANALTAVTDDVGAVFFNPASLAIPKSSRVGLGYIYGAPFLSSEGPGGKMEFDSSNEVVTVGMSLDMHKLFTSGRGLGFGLGLTIDENGKAFIRFEDRRSDDGQFLRYGSTSAAIVAGAGIEVIPMLNLGAGIILQLHGGTALAVNTDLGGNATNESMSLGSDTYPTPIVSALVRLEPINIGLTWRAENFGEMGPITADTLATVGGSPLATLPLKLSYRDAFIPMQVALGVAYDISPELLLAFDFTWHQWSRFVDIVEEKDDARRDSQFDFRDTFVPRLGIEWNISEAHTLRAGYFYDMTPVDGIGTYRPYEDMPNVLGFVIVDNDKHAASLGYGFSWIDVPKLNQPIKVDLAYQFHYLVPRTTKTSDGYKFQSEGTVHTGALTFSFGF